MSETNITPSEARLIARAIEFTERSVDCFYGKPDPPRLTRQESATLFELSARFKRLSKPADVIDRKLTPERKEQE